MKSMTLAVLAWALSSAASVVAQPADLSPNCQGAWGRYQAAAGRPKAFAMAPGRSCGWWQNNEAARTLPAIRDKAVNQCRTSGGGDACRLVDSQR